MKAIVLAAGYATRLYPLTADRPKALLPIGGRPILDHLMAEIAGIDGMTEAHIASNHKFFGQFQTWADQARREGRFGDLKIAVWDDQTTEDGGRLGAVGDIQFVIERADIDDDVLVAAADNYFTFPLKLFIDDFRSHGRDTLLAARFTDYELLRRFAVAVLDEQRRVLALVEKPETPRTDIGVYALYLYRRDTLPPIRQYLAEGNSPDAPGHLPEWLHRRREVRAYLFEGECVDIGTPESYYEAVARFG